MAIVPTNDISGREYTWFISLSVYNFIFVGSYPNSSIIDSKLYVSEYP